MYPYGGYDSSWYKAGRFGAWAFLVWCVVLTLDILWGYIS